MELLVKINIEEEKTDERIEKLVEKIVDDVMDVYNKEEAIIDSTSKHIDGKGAIPQFMITGRD